MLGKSRARLFLGLLILSLVSLQIPSAFATSVTVSYTVDDATTIPLINSISSNGGDNVVIQTGTTWKTESLMFDGVDDAARGEVHDLPYNDFSVVFDITPQFKSTERPLFGTAFDRYGIYLTTAFKFRFSVYTGGFVDVTSSAVSNMTRLTVAFVKNTAGIFIYINGVLDAADTTTNAKGNMIYASDDHRSYYGCIGNYDVATTFGNVTFYNAILTYSVKTDLTLDSNLIAWYKFDEGSGAKVYGYNTFTAWDYSTSKALVLSQTASAVNSSVWFYDMPYVSATDIWNDTYYIKRANTTTLNFIFTHYAIPDEEYPANVALSSTSDMWIWMGLIAQIVLLVLGYKWHYLFHVIAIGVGVYFFFNNWTYNLVISNSTGVFTEAVIMHPPNFFYALIAGLMVMHGLFLMTRAID